MPNFVVPLQFLQIGSDLNSDEFVVTVGEKLDELDREVRRVDQLVDQAAAADAELESGGGVLEAAAVVGAPLDVKADD